VNRLIYPIAAFVVTLLLHFLAGVSWAWSVLAGFVALPGVGFLVTIDDDFPGGWSNPDGSAPSPRIWSVGRGVTAAGLAVSRALARTARFRNQHWLGGSFSRDSARVPSCSDARPR